MTAKKTTPSVNGTKHPKAAKGKTPAPAKKTGAATKAKKLSALDAAAKVLAETGQPMNCLEMIQAMAGKGYWTSPGGLTPHATLIPPSRARSAAKAPMPASRKPSGASSPTRSRLPLISRTTIQRRNSHVRIPVPQTF